MTSNTDSIICINGRDLTTISIDLNDIRVLKINQGRVGLS